jgi:alkaline phosphatase
MTTRNALRGALISLALVVLCTGFAFAAGGIEEVPVPGDDTSMGEAKYVFMFIGDGMGLPQISAAEAYLASAEGQAVGIKKLSFSDFTAQGLTTTYAEDRFITGSAASATAMACGEKTTIGTIAMDGSGSRVLPTIAEMARDAGMKVGIVSSVDIDHATPAAFYAHAPSRGMYYEIGLQMIDSGFDYFGGGRVRLSKTPDGAPTVLEEMERNGFTIADNRSEFNALGAGDAPMYAFDYGFASDALEYEIDRERDDISIAEFTAKGIEVLDNPNGFFMMIEGGKIDWACHANDGVSAIHDTLAFDEAVREAIDFYNEHPDETLIIVTGDHECGGLTLGFAGTAYKTAFDTLAKQKVSFEAFNEYVFEPFKEQNTLKEVDPDELLPVIEEYFGLSDLSDYERRQIERAFARSMTDEEARSENDETYITYGGYEPLTIALTHIVNQRAGLAWTSYKHTGVPVPTFAMGPGAGAFHGYYDNTDIFHKTVAAMGLRTAVASR